MHIRDLGSILGKAGTADAPAAAPADVAVVVAAVAATTAVGADPPSDAVVVGFGSSGDAQNKLPMLV